MQHDPAKTRVLDAARNLLARTIGMDPDSVGPALLDRVLSERLARSGCASWNDYIQRLNSQPAELEQVVEQVIVPETWFFRDREPFTLLQEFARIRKRTPEDFFAALSAPCSTGEEPYSMAMALLDAGLDPEDFRIDAMDISRDSLEQARQGVFGKNSFRGGLPFNAERYFTETPDGRVVQPRVRDTVRFIHMNLVQPEPFCSRQAYDAVFCRNFLIYLQSDAKQRVIELLRALLKPHGLLFVGHAESLPLLHESFQAVDRPKTFAFRHRPDDKAKALTAAPPQASTPSGRRRAPVAARRDSRSRKAGPSASTQRPEPAPPPPSRPPEPTARDQTQTQTNADQTGKTPDLDQARLLADQGRLDEARSLCQHHIQTTGPGPEAYHLLGLLEEAARRRRQAEEYFKKALYLDPGREETLVHLALLAERQGETSRAAALRRRLQRLQTRSATGEK
jgi:chemotaxis protein methyltransferase WspC